MRVLLSAIACRPGGGSEGGVGWKAAVALAKQHEVHVLTSSENRESIESILSATKIPNLSFTYFGHNAPYHENRLIARGQSWLRYLAWMQEALPQARHLMTKASFDLVHHVTYSTCRVASPLWQVGLPLVFGPAGGGEQTPPVTLPSMSLGQRAYELLRVLANALLRFKRSVRQTITNSSALVASNRPTAALLEKLGAHPSKIIHLPVVFFTEERMQSLAERTKDWSLPGTPLRIFSSGMVEGRKGLSIALHAIALAREQGVASELVVPSRGPEFAHLKKLTRKLGLAEVVHFPESLPRDEFWTTLMRADICMMPSLRDNCPATLLEAMLCCCVPFVVDCNGPGEMVPEDVGVKIPPDRPEKMAEAFASRLVDLHQDRNALHQLALKAADHVRGTFTEQRFLETIDRAYHLALAGESFSQVKTH
jgi:glycosyltransferase involved in cell wall biosynthesis